MKRDARWQQQRRKEWRAEVATGTVACHLCGRLITKNDVWDLDHVVPLALGGHRYGELHPAHARCNRVEGADITNRKRLNVSRLAL